MCYGLIRSLKVIGMIEFVMHVMFQNIYACNVSKYLKIPLSMRLFNYVLFRSSVSSLKLQFKIHVLIKIFLYIHGKTVKYRIEEPATRITGYIRIYYVCAHLYYVITSLIIKFKRVIYNTTIFRISS